MHRRKQLQRRATRRDCLKHGAGLLASGLVAGCSDLAGQTERTATPGTDPYSVTIPPAGEVRFESVPETWVAENASWADMGVALGVGKPSAVVLTGEYRTWHYEDIPGLSAGKDDVTSLWQDGITKERFYDIDAGVHFIDPNYMTNLIPNWKQADVDSVTETVAPMCGNTSFSTYSWHEGYPYFSLYEATEKVANVFKRTDRFEALRTFHDETIGGIRERLPPKSERPEIALLSPGSTEPKKFYPYRIGERTAYKHWRDLGVGDALAGSDIESFTSDRGSIDYEPLLDIDPEMLFFYTDEHRTRDEFRETYLSFLREDATASQLTAVQNGDVYPAGGMYQGPISNLSKTERAARQLFGEEFGENERLYDRQRLGDIVSGEL
ncbi:ABC transporter substrate-binding protein [Haloarcula sp. S1CR25-12]|uniref:ABC transporter substrate-binding protein n=1 Tax=Haloarcula saliterrae TaxID=2950534 RepID=A0ABU2FG36_9EURY|nr:ABC transporter substrate-binding protein [Haloarcula sp. S1CR25-12]MDS0261203.1 ABC transporter substrate-binding protein [Haloarcula sp. S1CR25-12]